MPNRQKNTTQKLSSGRMTVRDTLSLSTRMFRTRPMRTALTILGVSVGVGAVLFLVSLGYGLQETILNKITTTDALLSLDVTASKSELIKLNTAGIEKIGALPNVEEVSPIAALSAQVDYHDLTGDATLYVVKPSFFRLSGAVTLKGKFFINNIEGSNTREAVVSSAMAEIMNIDPEKIIGEKINLTIFTVKQNDDGTEDVATMEESEPMTIVGVMQDKTESFVYVPAGILTSATVDSYVSAKVKVTNSAYMKEVSNKMIGMGFFVSALRDTIDQVKKVFNIVQIVLGLFGLVALVVSAIGMFNTMTVMLLERTNEIGIMRSVGVARKDVRKLFLFESMLMGFLGGLGGVVLGYLGGELANLGVNLMAKNFGGQALNLFVRPTWFVLVIIIFSTIIGLFTGVFPARKAARINPLEALRYK